MSNDGSDEPPKLLDTPLPSLNLSVSWTLAGTVVNAGCQWGILLVIVKLGSATMLGQMALALAVVAPVVQFTNLHLRVLQATDATRQFAFADYFGVRVLTTVVLLVAVLAIAQFSGYDREMTIVILAVALAKICESISDLFHGLLQQNERLDTVAISLMLQGALRLAACGLTLVLTESLLFAILAMASVSTLLLIFYDVKNARLVQETSAAPSGLGSIRPRWRAAAVWKILLLGLPLGVLASLDALSFSVPRYVVEETLGSRDLGIFAGLAYLIMPGAIATNAMGIAASSRLARYSAAQERTAFVRLVGKLVAVAAVIGVVGLLTALAAGREILALIYRPEYAEHMDTLLWLTAGAAPLYVAGLFGVAINATRRYQFQIPLSCIHLAMTYVLCRWLIPQNGLVGAGQALFAFNCVAATLVGAFLLTRIPKAKHDSKDSLHERPA